ncbi:hypothetical protein NQ317_019233, partial [Molorchus minor]
VLFLNTIHLKKNKEDHELRGTNGIITLTCQSTLVYYTKCYTKRIALTTEQHSMADYIEYIRGTTQPPTS